MDPKNYAQFMAMKEQAEKDAAAAAAAAKPKPQAAPRPRPATGTTAAPAVPKKAQPSAGLAPVKSVAQDATPKQTAPSAAPPVTDADEIATQKAAFDADLMKDLKLDYLYDRARTTDLDAALDRASRAAGVPVQRYRELAAIQSIDLDDLDKKARGGMPFENYKKAKQGAIGFAAPEARAALFDAVLKDYTTAQKGEIRTDKRLELAPAEEAPGLIPGFTTGYVIGHTTAEETPEVAKKGDHAYAVAEAYLAAIDKNPEVVHLVELYGNSFSAGSTQKYVNDRAQMLLRDRGIGPGSPEADRQASLARRQAMYEVLARKTVGQWTPGVFVKDVQVTDDAKAPDNPFAALYPNTELIGFNSKREAVFRQESPAGTALRALDVIGVVPIKKVPIPIPGQALMVGALTKGENETYQEAMSRGVQTSANWLEYALEETENSSTAGKFFGRGLGFLGAIAHPDVTLAAGSLNKSQKALRTTLATKKIARAADPILKRLSEAYKTQDFVTSNALEKEIAAGEILGRDQKHGVAAGLNRADDAFSMALSYMDPTLKSRDVRLLDKLVTIMAARDPELATFVYEAAGKGTPHLHFGVAAPEMAARSKSGVLGETYESFLNAGDFARRKQRVQLARQAFLKVVPQTAEEAIKRTMDDAIAAIGERAESAARMNAPGANLLEEMELAKILESNRASILAEPETWTAGKAQAILATNPVTGKNGAVKWRETAAAQVAQIADRVKTIKTQNYKDLVDEDMRIFDDMDRAIDANVKSRRMAAESMRRNLAKEANITITPEDILDDLLVEGTERLSPMAQAQFFGTMRQLPPGSDTKGFFTSYQLLDTVKKAEAQRLGIPLEEAWRRWLIEVRAGKAQAPMNVKPVDVPLPGAPTPAAPSAATKAAATATPPAAQTPESKEVLRALGTRLQGMTPAIQQRNGAQALARASALGWLQPDTAKKLAALNNEELVRIILKLDGETSDAAKVDSLLRKLMAEPGAPVAQAAAVVVAPAGSAKALFDDVMAKLAPALRATPDEVNKLLAIVDSRGKDAVIPSFLSGVNSQVQKAVVDYLVDQKILARSEGKIVKLTEKVEKAAKAAPAAATAAPTVRTPESFAAEIAAGKKFDTPEDLQFYENNRAAVEAELKRAVEAAPVAPAAAPVEAAAEEVTEATAKVAPRAPATGPAMPRRNWTALTKQERNQLIDLGVRGDAAREAGDAALAAELNAQANAIWAPKARLPVMSEPRPAAVRPSEPELIRPTPEPVVITNIPELPPLPDAAASKAAAKLSKSAKTAAAAEQKAIDTVAKAGLKKVAAQVNLHPKTTNVLADLDASLMAKPSEVSGILTELDRLPAGAKFPETIGVLRKVVIGAIRDQMVKSGKVIKEGKKTFTIAGDLTPSVAKPVESVAKATTKVAPSPEEALRQLGDAAQTAVEQGKGGRFTRHPLSPREGLSSGTFAGGSDASLEMDAAGNVILRRAADSIDSLTKEGKRKAELGDLIDQNFSTRTTNNDAVSTTAEKSFVSRYGESTMGPGRVVGTFKIPFQDLLEMVRRGEATVGNIGEAEVTLSGQAAKRYLSEINGLPIAEARAAEAAREAETAIYIPELAAAEAKAAPAMFEAAPAAASAPTRVVGTGADVAPFWSPTNDELLTKLKATASEFVVETEAPFRSLSNDELVTELNTAAAKLEQRGLPVPEAVRGVDELREMLSGGGTFEAIARGTLEDALLQATGALKDARTAKAAEAVVEAAPAEARAVKAPRGKKAAAPVVGAKAAEVVAEAPVAQKAAAQAETATADELQAKISDVVDDLDDVAGEIAQAESAGDNLAVAGLTGAEKRLQGRKADLEARLERLLTQPAPAPPPAATLENLGNREVWKNVKSRGPITASTGMIEARVGNVEFRISTVPAAKEGKPATYKIMAGVPGSYEDLGAKSGYASVEDALRALTPTASGPAPLRAEIDSLIRGGVQKADNTVKAAARAAKQKPFTAGELLAREFNEAFGYDVAGKVTTPKLKKSAYVAGERAAEKAETYEQSFAKYEEILKAAATDPARAEDVLKTIREEFELGLKRGQSLLAPSEVAAAPVMSAAEKLAKAQDRLSKITHLRMDSGGSATYGVMENGEFVARYIVSSGEIRSGNTASTLFDQAVSNVPPAGLTSGAAGAVRQISMQPTLKKIEQLVGDGELFQSGVTGGKAAPRGGIRFLSEEAREALRMQDPPTAIITLFREVADPTTLVHEAGHYLRKMVLDQDDMDAVVRWVNRNGINVTHEFGVFKGDAADINRAEELFADAFEAYMAKGKAPESRLQTLFERMKDVFAKVYRTLTKSAVNSDIDPEVKAVFDRLFSAVPDKQPESTFDIIMRHTFNNKGLESEGALTAIASEAKRLGLPGATVEILAKKVSQAAKAQGTNWEKEVILEFPVEVLGKKKWTGKDVLRASERIQSRRNEFAMAPLKQALFGAPEETKATEQIYTALEEREEGKLATGTRFMARSLAKSVIGGDIVFENGLRNLVPEIRRDLDTMPRIIGQAISDTISVLNQTISSGDNQFLYKFLAGDEALAYTSGRRVISSGHEFISGFLDMFRNAAAALSEEELAALQRFAQAINTKPDVQNLLQSQYRSEDLTRMLYPELNELGDAETIRRAMRQKTEVFSSAINKFRNLTEGGPASDMEVGGRLAKALKGITKEGAQANINQYRFTETLLYLSGVTSREGQMFVGVNKAYDNTQVQQAARILIEDTQKIFGSADDQLAARRLSIIVGAYGSAARAKAELAGLGLVLTKEEAAAYRNWTLGYGVTPEMRVKLEAVMRKFGANTEFQADTILGADVYIPEQARKRIADMLGKAQFNEQRLTPVGDIFLAAYAYTKKRMTRGNFLIRQRYFMVNTIDHFFQMSLIVGYAPAFQSMSRVALQNVMASLAGQGLETLARTAAYVSGGRLSPAWIEKFRDLLSRGGDKTAYWLRRMVSDSKYRLEVNDVLEGRNLPIVIGGHVTTGKRLREMFVAEGVFEAYNTRRLGQVVRQEGMAILEDGNGIFDAGLRDGTLAGNSATAWAKVKGAAEDILFGEMRIVDDLGDAWAERERVGAAITLIENGYEPRLACRLTIDALYDYGQSMTKMDRNWLVGLIFPFWAFQKNANQQFINVLATPYGAYRMMVLKRFRDRGGDLLTELYYDEVGGELGLDVKQMPQDMQDMYYAVMTKAHEVYGDEIPDDAKVALRMLLTNRDSEIIDGKVYELNADLIQKINSGGIAGVGGAGMSDYLLPRPNRSGLPSYLRDRPGILMAQRRTAEVRVFSALNGRNDESYFLMMPEASFETAMKHTATVLSTALLMGGYTATIAEGVVGGPMDAVGLPTPKEMLDLNARGLQGVDVLQAIKPVIDLERSPVAGPIIGLYAQRGYPQRVHPVIAKYMQNFSDVPILRVPAKMDPFENEDFVLDLGQLDENGKPKDITQILGEDYMRTVQEINSKDIDLRDMSTLKAERFYLPPGGYSIAFENFPFLGEFNKELLLKYDVMLSGKTTPETADDLGKTMTALKNLTGLDVARVSAARTAQMEEPVFYTKSRKPF